MVADVQWTAEQPDGTVVSSASLTREGITSPHNISGMTMYAAGEDTAAFTVSTTRAKRGTGSFRILGNSSTGHRTNMWTGLTQETGWFTFRGYYYFESYPAPQPIRLFQDLDANYAGHAVMVMASGAVAVLNPAGQWVAVTGSGVANIPLNQWFRLEYSANQASKTQYVRMYSGADVDSTTHTWQGTYTYTSTPAAWINGRGFGAIGTWGDVGGTTFYRLMPNGSNLYMDDLAIRWGTENEVVGPAETLISGSGAALAGTASLSAAGNTVRSGSASLAGTGAATAGSGVLAQQNAQAALTATASGTIQGVNGVPRWEVGPSNLANGATPTNPSPQTSPAVPGTWSLAGLTNNATYSSAGQRKGRNTVLLTSSSTGFGYSTGVYPQADGVLYGRGYYYLTGYPPNLVAQLFGVSDQSWAAPGFWLGPNGALLYSAPFSPLSTGVTLPLSQWFRLEFYVKPDDATQNAIVSYRYYANPDSTTPTSANTYSNGTNWAASLPYQAAFVGIGGGWNGTSNDLVTTSNVYVDRLAVSEYGWIGPAQDGDLGLAMNGSADLAATAGVLGAGQAALTGAGSLTAGVYVQAPGDAVLYANPAGYSASLRFDGTPGGAVEAQAALTGDAALAAGGAVTVYGGSSLAGEASFVAAGGAGSAALLAVDVMLAATGSVDRRAEVALGATGGLAAWSAGAVDASAALTASSAIAVSGGAARGATVALVAAADLSAVPNPSTVLGGHGILVAASSVVRVSTMTPRRSLGSSGRRSAGISGRRP